MASSSQSDSPNKCWIACGPLLAQFLGELPLVLAFEWGWPPLEEATCPLASFGSAKVRSETRRGLRQFCCSPQQLFFRVFFTPLFRAEG